jgi:prophage tail gpP-like protein
MPNPAEIALVIAGGQSYDIWQSLEVHREWGDPIAHALLTVAEISTPSALWTALKLKPGDQASVSLAGQSVIEGIVYLRQSAYDKQSHAVQIGIASKSHDVIPSTVDANPGQYKNYTLQQIGSAVFGKVGVGFNVIGASGADKIFARVNEQVGESRFEFIERLCRMRNVHMLDDGKGTMNAMRGPQGSANAVLQEGGNILRARLILKNNEYAEQLSYVGQQPNAASGDASRSSSASTTLPPFYGNKLNRSMKLPAWHPGDSQDMQMAVNHEADFIAYDTVDGDITVQGWMLDNGGLWWDQVGKLVTVNSPMLLPEDSMQFLIKGVIHKQSNEDGTTTDVLLARQDGMGGTSGEALGADGPSPSAPGAQSDGADI